LTTSQSAFVAAPEICFLDFLVTQSVTTVIVQLNRCVHKLSNFQKVDLRKIIIEVVNMQTAKIQLNSGLLPLYLTFKI